MNPKRIITLLLLCLSLALGAQVNGELNTIGDKHVLHVWGNHYERGQAQGYYMAPQIMEVFNDFYWTMFCFSDASFYTMLWNYYQEHFITDDRMLSEAQGMIYGMQMSGTNLHHNGIGRNLEAEDILLLNAVWDMVSVRSNKTGKNDLVLGCASLSSWGAATSADSLLAEDGVITRFLDISQNSALINNPLMVVHHPSETDEQKWANVTLPGFFGSLTAISGSMNYASLNTASDSWAPNPYNLSPILFDLRRGIERLDFDANSITNPVDIFASIQTGTQLSANIIHTLGESNGEVYSSVIETNNSTTQFRLYNQSGNLPTHHLAATNHFRLISSPVCCNRYSNIQDSLYSNPFVDAKRQWRVLSGAAGLETTLTAIQFTPSTGMILWSSASLAAPAYLLPALSLNLGDLFSNPVSNSDDYLVAAKAEISLYPNPHSRQQNLYIKSTEELATVELYNIKGQRLNSWTVDSVKGSILLQTDWSSYSRGVYLLKAKTAKGKILSSRMILQ